MEFFDQREVRIAFSVIVITCRRCPHSEPNIAKAARRLQTSASQSELHARLDRAE
jgi:hypothetical protein